MAKPETMEERISDNYVSLSDKLKVAADFVAANPVDVATRSLRAVAGSSGVSPATFSRLARALGYADYEELREAGRAAVGRKMVPFSERAHALLTDRELRSGETFLHRQASACIQNIQLLDQTIQGEKIEQVVDALHHARHVVLVGALGSSGFIDYIGYLAHWFNTNWSVAGRNGTPLAASMSRLDSRDVVIVLTKTPYARRAMLALEAARRHGVVTVVITDSHSSPALEFGDVCFIVPTESPQFFSSYAATLVLLETIISLLLAKRGEDAEDMIRTAENQIHNLGETWGP